MPKEPTTLPAFRRYLADEFDLLATIDELGEPDGFQQFEISETVAKANRLACRFGAGHLAEPVRPLLTAGEALPLIGRLLAWAESRTEKKADLLTVSEVAGMLGVSARSVWRLVSTGEVPRPVKVGTSTRWRRADIEAMIEILTVKR